MTRGICSVNEQGHLTKVTETKNIVKTAEGAAVQAEDGSLTAVQAHCPVSMNMWGFTPEIFGILEKGFAEFLGALKDQTLSLIHIYFPMFCSLLSYLIYFL